MGRIDRTMARCYDPERCRFQRFAQRTHDQDQGPDRWDGIGRNAYIRSYQTLTFMITRYTLGLLLGAACLSAQSQDYCEPTFANGCFNWRNIAIEVGDASWSEGVDPCDLGDHTDIVANVDAGSPIAMSVTNGVWCGCAVWVDMDNSSSFEPSENVYFGYSGADPSQTYSFDLVLPEELGSGTYRMRVIAPWGSDGFTEGGSNGFGPCGAYQYGSFTDITLNYTGAAGVTESTEQRPWFGPTPGNTILELYNIPGLREVQVAGMDGRVQRVAVPVQGQRIQLDMSTWANGTYVVRAFTDAGIMTGRWVKQ
jgi:hypothetical protein